MSKLLVALQQKMGDPDVEGDEYTFECPRCGHGKKKFGVNLNRMLFNCWHCHWGGRMRDLLDYLGIDLGDVVPRALPAQKEVRQHTPVEIPGFHPIGTDPEADIERDILELCRRRGRLSEDQIRARGWGWSDEKYLWGRLIMPVRIHGQCVQYLARAVYDFVEPKEKVGPTGLGWWPKTDVLYGVDVKRSARTTVLVEGIWDYEAVKRAVPDRVLSLMGTQLGDVALGLVLSGRPERIVLLFDGDEAGARANVTVAEKIRKRHFTEIYIARPPKGLDPDDVEVGRLGGLVSGASPYFSWLLENPRLKASFKSCK